MANVHLGSASPLKNQSRSRSTSVERQYSQGTSRTALKTTRHLRSLETFEHARTLLVDAALAARGPVHTSPSSSPLQGGRRSRGKSTERRQAQAHHHGVYGRVPPAPEPSLTLHEKRTAQTDLNMKLAGWCSRELAAVRRNGARKPRQATDCPALTCTTADASAAPIGGRIMPLGGVSWMVAVLSWIMTVFSWLAASNINRGREQVRDFSVTPPVKRSASF